MLVTTSFLNFSAASFICFAIFEYCLTNLAFILFNPIRSSVTKTCPSQYTEAPIPIVGILIVFVISFARELSIHSKTIPNTPAGVFGIVLECIESSLAKEITKTINIPTIGIGASVYCDGQVLVTDDLIGLNKMKARFVKQYSNIAKQINDAALKFKKDVVTSKFPTKKHSY